MAHKKPAELTALLSKQGGPVASLVPYPWRSLNASLCKDRIASVAQSQYQNRATKRLQYRHHLSHRPL